MTVNAADLPIRIALESPDLRQGRLYLTPDGTTNLDVGIAAAGKGALALEAGDRLSLDFGQLRLNAAEADSLGSPDWTGIWTPERLAFDLKSGRALTDQGMRLHVKIPSLAGPFPKPLGTLFVTLERQGRLLGMTEVEQSLTGGRPSSPTLPPVLVRWEGDETPTMLFDKANRLAFTIVNVRRTRRGTVKALSTMARDLMNCRVRLTFVPAYRQGGLATMIGDDAKFTVSARLMTNVAGRVEPEWVAEKLSNDTWEVSPPKQDARVLGEEEGLRIVLDNVAPQRLGTYALCVTLFDFPGYPSASWSLPVSVLAAVEIVEFGGRLAPGGSEIAELWWHLRSGGHMLNVEITGSEGQSKKLAGQDVGHLDMPIRATTNFTMKVSQEGVICAERTTTVFVSEKRDFSSRIKITSKQEFIFGSVLSINCAKVDIVGYNDEIIIPYIEFKDGRGLKEIDKKNYNKIGNNHIINLNTYNISGTNREIKSMIENVNGNYRANIYGRDYTKKKNTIDYTNNEVININNMLEKHIKSKIKSIFISVAWGGRDEKIYIDIPIAYFKLNTASL